MVKLIKITIWLLIFSQLPIFLFLISLEPAKQTNKLNLRYFTSSKKRDYPMKDELITIKVNEQYFEVKTNKKGIAQFNISCDQEVTIYFQGKPSATFKRFLICGKPLYWTYFFNSFAEEGKQIEQIK
jgi:hypothetical protein